MPILSVIIPTKNRQYTCLFAIESALMLRRPDVEIIVQDCSDTDVLKTQIADKFGTPAGLKYFYSGDSPSMTENWNRAYDNATGEYQCAIGDDDAVLPELYDVTLWARANKMEAVSHTAIHGGAYSYKWHDFGDKALQSKLVVVHPFNGKVEKAVNAEALIDQVVKNVDMRYNSLPMAYHCLLAATLLQRVKKETGKLLDSTSLDVYSGYVFGLLTKSFAFVNYPFTIYGACGKSNTNRLSTGRAKEHFREFKTLHFPALIPKVYNTQTTIAESMHCAFTTLKRSDLIKKINLPQLYAFSAAEGLPEFRATIRCMVQNKLGAGVWAGFAKLFTLKLAKKFVRFCMGDEWVNKRLQNKEQVLVPCSDILEAVAYHEKNNNVPLFGNEKPARQTVA